MIFVKKNLVYQPRGFTMMELLISIAIFVIITAMVIVNFRSGQYRDELLGGAEAIETALREMQTKTNSGETVICPEQSDPGPPPDGYGVQIINNTSIIAFADCGAVHSDKYTYESQDDLLLKTVLLPANVALKNPVPGLPWNIVFSPFSEVVIVNTNYDSTSVVQITLKHSRTEREITVKLNRLTGQTSYE